MGGQSVDSRMAGTGNCITKSGNLSGLLGYASGSREGNTGQRGEFTAPVAPGNIATILNQGIAAMLIFLDLMAFTSIPGTLQRQCILPPAATGKSLA